VADQPDLPGPAARIRRLAIDAAGAKLAAKTQRAEANALGRMFAHIEDLTVLRNAGVTDPGVAPYAFTYEDPRPRDELLRFLGSEKARELGFAGEEAPRA
jgi:hypothetical protein